MIDIEWERAAAAERRKRRQIEEGAPRFLLLWLKEDGGTMRPRHEILAVAQDRLGKRFTASEIDQVVDNAIRIRDENRAHRIDLTAADGLQHPSRRSTTMPNSTIDDATRERMREWTRDRVAELDDPTARGVVSRLHREAMEHFDVKMVYNSFRGTYFQPALEALEAEHPSTNGAKPAAKAEPPQEPPTGDAEPDPAPATEPVGGEESGQEGAEGAGEAPDEDLGERLTAGEEKAATSASSGSWSITVEPATRRVQVDVSADRARLFADLHDLPPALAYRLAAQLQLGLAEEAA